MITSLVCLKQSKKSSRCWWSDGRAGQSWVFLSVRFFIGFCFLLFLSVLFFLQVSVLAFLINLFFYLFQILQILSNCFLSVYFSYWAYLFYALEKALQVFKLLTSKRKQVCTRTEVNIYILPCPLSPENN